MSRNHVGLHVFFAFFVAPREGRVSRNFLNGSFERQLQRVAPREGRVSRNSVATNILTTTFLSRPARGV